MWQVKWKSTQREAAAWQKPAVQCCTNSEYGIGVQDEEDTAVVVVYLSGFYFCDF